MGKYLINAIFATFGISTALSLILIIIVKEINRIPSDADSFNWHRMDCFAGLEYAIPIGIQVVFAIAGSSALISVYKNIRKNKFLVFCSFFSIQIILVLFTLKSVYGESEIWILLLYALLYFIPLTYFYFKFRKKFTLNN